MPRKESKAAAWLKMLFGAIAGLFSGALVMYLSPLVDKVVKPPRPIANFAVEYEGLTVRFTNRSTAAVQGYWDFGDGTPLEFLTADQPVVSHTYRKPGSYTARLVVSNVLGEQDERSVTLNLTAEEPPKTIEKPTILTLQVRGPSRPGGPVYAPATLQFEAIADNAAQFVWDFGDGEGLHIGEASVVRTFERPGTYRVRLCAFNGREKDEEVKIIRIEPPPAVALRVQVRVADAGVFVETRRREVQVSQLFDGLKADPRNRKAPTSPEVSVPAAPGYVITAFERLEQRNENIDKVDWKIVREGQLLKGQCAIKKGADRAVLQEKLVIVEQRRDKMQPEPTIVTGVLPVPGVVTLSLPSSPEDWSDFKRTITIQVFDGDKLLWQSESLPTGQSLSLGGRSYTLSGSLLKDRLTLQLSSPL